MGRREKKVKSLRNYSSEEDRRKRKATAAAVDSDDDTEANADLSLKIVQKSMRRAVKNDPSDDGIYEMAIDPKEKKKKKEKKERKKRKETEVPQDSVSHEIDTSFRDFCGDLVDNVKENDTSKEERSEIGKAASAISIEAVETNPVEVSDNSVMRKLLRGPRYFDPPDSSWGTCHNCGEEGHMIANCTSAKRKKPCFVCGSFEHNARQCPKGLDCCFICNQHGHRAKICPEKYKISKICLKCGDLGHEMFSCRNDYCPDDIKEIQCYICGSFGHICCVNYSDPGPSEVSCYRCGLSGHTGLACNGSHSHGSTYNNTSFASSCYKCGVEGHFARECTSSLKSVKRDREPSTPKHRSSKKNKERMEPYSAPQDIGKTRKKKKPQFGEFASTPRTKNRRGWTTEHPEDSYSYNKSNANNNWRTPSNSSRGREYYGRDNYASSPHSFQKTRQLNFNNSPVEGSTRSYQHGYSASRFNYYNQNDNSRGKYNNWW